MTVIGGRYVLRHEIGRGASGAVWSARDSQLGRDVAVKLLRPESAADATGRGCFEREARTVAQLRSSHIVQIHDAVLHDAVPFIVMELLDGESLFTRLERQSRAPIAFAARVATDVAQALTLTHRAGIVHRDLKPANVFIARDGCREVAKLLDFGVATLVRRNGSPHGAQHTGRTSVAGTPHYMSPEQIEGIDVDHRADVWALSVLVYQMLTGRLPFAGESLIALAVRIRTAAFVPASSFVTGIDSTRLDRFFARALTGRPEERFQSAAELATELVAMAEAVQGRGADATKRVLFVDDEPDMEFLIQQRFRRHIREGQFEFHFALDGLAGLDLLRRHPEIDVVVTDLNMPRMDGLTFLRRIPEIDAALRVVVVSAYSDMDNIRAAMNLGAFDFLGKPIDFDDLERTIAKCAADVALQRKSSRAREENGILRALAGGGSADRMISSVRVTPSAVEEPFEGAVAFVRVHGFDELLVSDAPSVAFDALNEQILAFGNEVLARGGTIDRFAGASLLAVFRGEDYLVRAAETCLAIRDRMRVREVDTSAEVRIGVAVGLGVGTLWAGRCGSVELGRVEHTVFGRCIASAIERGTIATRNEILVSHPVYIGLGHEFTCELLIGVVIRVDPGCDATFKLVARARRSMALQAATPQEEAVVATQTITLL